MWAIPVLLASLVFWPIWLVVIAGGAVRFLAGDFVAGPRRARDPSGAGTVNLRALPRRGGEALVARIAIRKYDLLAYAALTAGVLAVTALAFLIDGKGHDLTSIAGDVEGFVAIAGLVLGLPALAYAMVTDSTVERIEGQLGRDRSKEVETRIGARLHDFEQDLPGHTVQVFLPDLQQTRLLPVYDPGDDGPDEGWAIDRKTPQALTGSAWVGRNYLWGVAADLKQAKLRLTPDQLEEYEDLKAVAAAPVFGKGHLDPLGVLTVYSKSDDGTIGTEAFIQKHKEAAKSLSRIIDDYVPESGPLSQHDLSSRPRP